MPNTRKIYAPLLALLFIAAPARAQDPLDSSSYGYDGYSLRYRQAVERRAAEQARRILARQRLSVRSYTDELRAATWMPAIHALDDRGLTEEAARCRKTVMRLYPDTSAAMFAHEWLFINGFK